VIMTRYLIGVMTLLLLVGCGTQIAVSGKEREEYLGRIKPYGARWVKEEMTREGRKVDWVACGGGAKLGNGFMDLIKPESWETYYSERERHTQKLWACMHAKGYEYRNPAHAGLPDQCDAHCLYP